MWEDEPEVRQYLATALHCLGYAVECAADGDDLLQALRSQGDHVSALVLDLTMPQNNGMETLREIRRVNRELPVIMLSGADSPFNAVEAMRCGATNFLSKPVSHEDLDAALRSVLNGGGIAPLEARRPEFPSNGKQSFVTKSPAMVRIGELLRKLGAWDVPVLIRGETGSGKEVVARQLHALSLRAHRPFLKLNCAALPSELVESELFGYERGAFTGAFQKKAGMFELADEGTLLLDEIGDMDFKLQAKLLQVLQDQEFRHLGGKDTIRVNVRIIAATHRDLEQAMRGGTFREDLYYRLNVVRILIPPLRERKEDILPLCGLFLSKHAPPGTAGPPITPALRQALLNHNWPGNVRELENLMRMYLVLQDQQALADELRPPGAPPAGAARSAGYAGLSGQLDTAHTAPVLSIVNQAKEEAEVQAILAALNATMWCRKEAARLLKMDYRALLYKMRKLAVSARIGGSCQARAGRISAERIGPKPDGDGVLVRCAKAGS